VVSGYKDRRGWLVAFGIFEFLIAAFFLLMAVMMAVIVPRVPMPSGQPAFPPAFFLVIAGFYLAVAALFVAVGIGSILARNWARIVMIAISSLWLAFGVLGTISSAVLMPMILRQQEAILRQSHPETQPLNLGVSVIFVVIAFQALLMVAVPLIFLLFYVGKNVRATCQGNIAAAGAVAAVSAPALPVPAAVAAQPARTPPVPVMILAAWYAFSGLSVVGALWLPMAVVFGVVVRGVPGRLLMLGMGCVSLFCAWGIYKLRREGWWTAVAFSVFGLVSGLATAIRLDMTSFNAEVYQAMGISPPAVDIFKMFPGFMTFCLSLGVVLAAGLLGLLFYAKRYFLARERTS
jgi:hypothetical protein